jgi:hypothetical protein
LWSPSATQGAGSNHKDSPVEQAKQGKQALNREGLGHSRGGLTSKIHLAADHRCRPLVVLTSEGQRHDSIAFVAVMDAVRVPRVGPGRPRSRPDWVLADRAYGSRGNRAWLTRHRIKVAIPVKTDQAAARRRKGRDGGRPPNFDTQRYRDRNTVERAVNKLRETRAVGTRYDKRDYIFRGTITVSAIRIWLRDPAVTALPNTP